MTNPWKCEEIIGDCRLLLGDCREILPTLGKVDHIISDPPYGAAHTHAGHLGAVTLRNGEHAGRALGFDGFTSGELLEHASRWCALAQRWVVFTSEWKFMNALDERGLLVRFGIWRKPDGAPQFTGDRPGTGWEGVAVCHREGRKRWNGGGRHAFWTHPKGENQSGHPTGKPLGLFVSFVLDFTDDGDVVLDPFMGSGTTGVACVKLGRKFIGIEIDEGYFEIACRRIREAYAQPDMLIEAAKKPEQIAMEIG